MAGMFLVALARAAVAADIPVKAPPSSPTAYDWTGFYLGGHLGYVGGKSSWSTRTIPAGAPDAAGSFNLFQPFDPFNEAGSFSAGVHAGYNRMLANRWLIGIEADATVPAWPNLTGYSIGNIATFVSPTVGPSSYMDTILHYGSVRGRVGYAPGNWLLYATGGFAWSYNQITYTQLTSGTSDAPFLWRLGWTAGLGIEAPVMPHWTARLEYLYSDFGVGNVSFPQSALSSRSSFSLQEIRAGVSYYFGSDTKSSDKDPSSAWLDSDRVNFHGQTTLTEQFHPSFRAPYGGANSLSGSAVGRETFDATLYAGVRLWEGAELWINPELDQG
ncbi:MAG: porin family protein, partial [Alphaproteobacteria bacterium]|nr:porin family protein [Alphaproteobacteria bacterium]